MASPVLLKTPSNVVLQQEFLERSLNSLFSSSKHLPSTSFKEEQISLQKSLDKKRNEEMKGFLQSFCSVMTSIKALKTDISCEENIYKKDMSYFEESLRNIEESLSVFKSELKDKISVLRDEEKELQTLISTLNQRISLPIDMETKTTTTLLAHVDPQISTNSAYDNMHPDIQEFHNFVQKSGGHSGGWTSADHVVFCKLLQKRGSHNLVTAVLELMPDKSEEDVNNHATWYERYLTLKQAHRLALCEWKKSKIVNIAEENTEGRPPSQPDLPRIMSDINRSKEVKARIAEWKKKQDEKRRKEEEKILLQKRKEEEKWKRKMAYFERQRNLLLQHKKEKEAVNLSKQVGKGPLSKQLKEVERLEKMLENSRLTLKDFREFDDEFLKRRMSRLERHRRRSSIDSYRHRSSSFSSMAKRDPTRLLQPTAIWRIRLNRSKSESNNEEQPRTTQFFINNIPHLGVPEWRKGILRENHA